MTMSRDHRRQALRKLLELVLPTVEAQPADQRADYYDGIAAACNKLDPDAASTAASAAMSLREAQSQQQLFRDLLKSK